VLDEGSEVEEVDKDGGWTDEDVGKMRGVDFTEVAGEKAELQVPTH
jgi:hypothetical protein